MTIDELLAITGLTASDEIPIWDAEATGEPTKKITAANLASGVAAIGGFAPKSDLTSIIATGTTNTTGAAITTDNPYFYLNGVLVKALTNIASGATFTDGTNYEAVTAGGLNSLNSKIAGHSFIELTATINSSYTVGDWIVDPFDLPNVTERCLFMYFNTITSDFGIGIKRDSDQKIKLSTSINANVSINISGMFK